MANIDLSTTVAQLVIEKPARARVFEQLDIDYCCGGKKPLRQACEEKGVNVDEVVQRLLQVEENSEAEERDWSQATLTELCEHIVQTHHEYLRQELPRLSELARKVADAHRERHPEWDEVREVYESLRFELQLHMQKEEHVLFPAIMQMEQANAPLRFHFGTVANPIRMMEYEHDNAAEALRRLRHLTNGYTPAEDACPTTRALLDSLQALEKDLYLHIHKENNILHPRAIALEEQLLRR
ncbi:MAG: iron-sulfur cluster repair di-iron protein [Chthonomonadetes bacterium]|nr:iron-sulfur cluster repair di-iron protein [Chthonomonadetes bacterium]